MPPRRAAGPVESDDDGHVLAGLARLGERDREALTLVAWDGLTPSEAAAVLGEPAARFRVRLHRAGRRLRAQPESRPDPAERVAEPLPRSCVKGARA